MESFELKLLQCTLQDATKVISTTLIGSSGPFPRERGNCFSVESNGIEYQIINFVYENLIHLIETKVVEWPVKIKTIMNCAVIVDGRIPAEFYSQRICEVCTPFSLLPINQQVENWRKQLAGEMTVSDPFDTPEFGIKGMRFVTQQIGKKND